MEMFRPLLTQHLFSRARHHHVLEHGRLRLQQLLLAGERARILLASLCHCGLRVCARVGDWRPIRFAGSLASRLLARLQAGQLAGGSAQLERRRLAARLWAGWRLARGHLLQDEHLLACGFAWKLAD